MGTNREPFPKKSCFHRGVGLVSSLEYYSFDGILMIYSLTHRVPTQIRHDPVFGGANVASAQAGSKQTHKTTRRYKKDLAEGSRIMWEDWSVMDFTLSSSTHLSWISSSKHTAFAESMLSVVNTWFPEESEKSESNSRADETDDSHMPEKSWSNQHYFFRCQKLNVRVPSMLACALPESSEPSLPSRLYLEGKRTQTLPISATLHYTEHSQLSFCPVL